MAKLATLFSLRNQAQRRAGLRGSEDVSQDDWTDIINASISRLWDRVTKNEIGYGRNKVTFASVQGQEEYALPADHMITVGLYRPDAGNNSSKYSSERVTESWYLDNHPDDEYSGRPIYWYTPTGIILRPIPSTSTEQIDLLYITTPPVLVNDTDTIDVVVNWEDAIIEFACAEAQQKQTRRQYHEQKAERLVSQSIEKWGTRRDRGPNWVKLHRRGRRNHGY